MSACVLPLPSMSNNIHLAFQNPDRVQTRAHIRLRSSRVAPTAPNTPPPPSSHQLQIYSAQYKISRGHKSSEQDLCSENHIHSDHRSLLSITSLVCHNLVLNGSTPAMPLSQPLLLAQSIPKSKSSTTAKNVLGPLQGSLRPRIDFHATNLPSASIDATSTASQDSLQRCIDSRQTRTSIRRRSRGGW